MSTNLFTTAEVAAMHQTSPRSILFIAQARRIEPHRVAGRANLWTAAQAKRLAPDKSMRRGKAVRDADVKM